MSNYESTLAKARKLSAILAPGANASSGEIQNARAMLRALCEKHGISAEALSKSARKKMDLECRPVNRRGEFEPIKGKLTFDMAILATACLKHTTNDAKRDFDIFVRSKKVGKRTERNHVIQADVTQIEYDDWRECFQHYAPVLHRAQQKAQENIKAARKAADMVSRVFINEFDLFADDTPANTKPPDEATLKAWKMAAGGITGDTWEKKAGHLNGSRIFLE